MRVKAAFHFSHEKARRALGAAGGVSVQVLGRQAAWRPHVAVEADQAIVRLHTSALGAVRSAVQPDDRLIGLDRDMGAPHHHGLSS